MQFFFFFFLTKQWMLIPDGAISEQYWRKNDVFVSSYRTEFTIISLKNLGVRLCNIISYPLSEGKQIVKIIECVYKWIYQEKSNIFAQM